jgi:hypothetical protein
VKSNNCLGTLLSFLVLTRVRRPIRNGWWNGSGGEFRQILWSSAHVRGGRKTDSSEISPFSCPLVRPPRLQWIVAGGAAAARPRRPTQSQAAISAAPPQHPLPPGDWVGHPTYEGRGGDTCGRERAAQRWRRPILVNTAGERSSRSGRKSWWCFFRSATEVDFSHHSFLFFLDALGTCGVCLDRAATGREINESGCVISFCSAPAYSEDLRRVAGLGGVGEGASAAWCCVRTVAHFYRFLCW